jgi:hypothetical protein
VKFFEPIVTLVVEFLSFFWIVPVCCSFEPLGGVEPLSLSSSSPQPATASAVISSARSISQRCFLM